MNGRGRPLRFIALVACGWASARTIMLWPDGATLPQAIETAFPLDRAAAALAGEQSSGTFVRVHGETDELRDRHLAKVERLTPLDESPTPSFRRYQRCFCPMHNGLESRRTNCGGSR